MTNLGVRVVLALLAATIEVRYLTLLLCGDEFCGERNADCFPTDCPVNVVVGSALVPHTLIAGEGVAGRCIEVLTVHQEMVVLGYIVTYSILHDSVSEDDVGILDCYGSVVRIGLGECRFCQVVGDNMVGLAVGIGCIASSLGRIDEPVSGDAGVAQCFQSVVVEQRREEASCLQARLIVGCSDSGICCDVAIVASEVDGCHAIVCQTSGIAALVRSEDGVRVVVCHTHLAALEVSRSAIYAVVVERYRCQACADLIDIRRPILMVTFVSILVAIGEALSEEQVVVGPDGMISLTQYNIFVQTDILVLRNCSIGIDEVTIGIAVLDIAKELGCSIERIDGILWCVVLRYWSCRQSAIGISREVCVFLIARSTECLVEVALVEVEAIEVVGHLAVVECLERHLAGIAMSIGGFAVLVGLWIVAVDNLLARRVFGIVGITEDGLHCVINSWCFTVYPTVLDIACTSIHKACAGECTGDTKVVDFTAEALEE